MKSFKQFIIESTIPEKNTAQGVIIFPSANKAFVGVDHGKPVRLGRVLLGRVTLIGNEYGYNYEGTGEGIDIKQPLFNLNSKEDYKTGWDEDRMKFISKNGIKPHHLSILFSDVDENWGSLKKKGLQGPGTILDALHRVVNHPEMTAFGGAQISREQVEDFLVKCDEGRERPSRWLHLAKTTSAEGTGSKRFLKKLEKRAWPEDWYTRVPNIYGRGSKTAAESLVNIESYSRNSHVLDNMGPGVYVMGSGHIKQIEGMLQQRGIEDYDVYGGEQIK